MPTGREVRTANHDPIDEVVDRVTNQDDGCGGTPVNFAVVGVAVPPEHEFFENEEQKDGPQESAEYLRGRTEVECFRQERHQGDRQERTDGVTHEPRKQAVTRAIRKQQERARDEEPAKAADGAERNRTDERRHAGAMILG